MLVFSVSLIRLVYDMIHKDVDPALQIVSAWMVLSVGLIDLIVYVSPDLSLDCRVLDRNADMKSQGLAEFWIKRKVRRKMGDRL